MSRPTTAPTSARTTTSPAANSAKIVAGAAGWTETPTGQTFEDVPPGSTFYLYIERMASRGIIGGYPCGGAGRAVRRARQPPLLPPE